MREPLEDKAQIILGFRILNLATDSCGLEEKFMVGASEKSFLT